MEKNSGDLEKYKEEMTAAAQAARAKIIEEQKSRDYIGRSGYLLSKIKNEAVRLVREAVGVENADLELLLPPAHVEADFCFGVFEIAKTLKRNPVEIAKIITDHSNFREFEFIWKINAQQAFINIEVKKEKLYGLILGKIQNLQMRFGESDNGRGKTVVVDFSAPNIAKPIGVGHLRSTIIGNALAKIYRETGYFVIRDNHLGDWGTQFGKLIWAYLHWGDDARIAQDPVEELKNLYVRFHEYSKDHPESVDEARELFARLEANDPQIAGLWKKFRDLSLADFERVYERLGVEFDIAIGESYFAAGADEIVNNCFAKGICRKDEESSAVVVDQLPGIPSFLMRKQDGSSLYMTRDVAALDFRIKNFNPETILYVVGSEQELNFKQMFAFALACGYLNPEIKAKHIGFGMVLVDGKKMSTREGTIIELEELIAQSVQKSKDVLLQKNPNIGEADLGSVSEIVGIGAIIYNDLKQSRIRNITFDWQRMLDFEGGSAVYLQYTYARIRSVLRKFAETGEIDSLLSENAVFVNKSEFEVAKKLMIFPEVIINSQQTDFPHYICSYLEELAGLFNSFYNDVTILNAEDKKIRASRLVLVACTALVIKKGLALLGIKVPERM